MQAELVYLAHDDDTECGKGARNLKKIVPIQLFYL